MDNYEKLLFQQLNHDHLQTITLNKQTPDQTQQFKNTFVVSLNEHKSVLNQRPVTSQEQNTSHQIRHLQTLHKDQKLKIRCQLEHQISFRGHIIIPIYPRSYHLVDQAAKIVPTTTLYGRVQLRNHEQVLFVLYQL